MKKVLYKTFDGGGAGLRPVFRQTSRQTFEGLPFQNRPSAAGGFGWILRWVASAILVLLFLVPSVMAEHSWGGFRYVESVRYPITATITGYTGIDRFVTVPMHIGPNSILVTGIGAEAFRDQSAIRGVSLPDSITSIGNSAFRNCSGMIGINLPAGLTSIGSYAFAYCSSLTGVTIPGSVTSIGAFAFSYCSSLAGITVDPANPSYSSLDGVLFDKTQTRLIQYPIGKSNSSYVVPAGVVTIGNSAFRSCTFLTSVTIPDSVINIEAHALRNCTALETVRFHGDAPVDGTGIYTGSSKVVNYVLGWTSWWADIYGGRPVVVLSASEGLEYTLIDGNGNGVRVMDYKGADTDVVIPPVVPDGEPYAGEAVLEIDSHAFSRARSVLTSVTIGNGVTSIGGGAFHSCTALTSITVDPANPSFSSLDGVLFDKTQATLIRYPIGRPDSSYTIPGSVSTIGFYAFSGCTSLTSVMIGNGVVTIGGGAFSGCTSLTSVTIGNGVVTIGGGAFSYCAALTGITVDPANSAYSSLDGVLFNRTQTTLIQYPIAKPNSSYTIPDSVISIGNSAFRDCASLTSVMIGNSVVTIGISAFYRCTSLTSVTIPDSLTSIDSSAFHYCTSLTSVTIPDSVTSIGSQAFYGCTSLTSVTIGNSVVTIGISAFSDCTSLTSVTIPDSVTSIGSYAFYGCTSLTSVMIGNGVGAIGDMAFSGCTSLTSVTIPDSVTSIGSQTFSYCTSLASITVAAANPAYSSLDGVLFDKTRSALIQYPIAKPNGVYAIPAGVIAIEKEAFYSCANLVSVTIPNSVVTIGDRAFIYCASLSSVTFGNSVASIGNAAFYGTSLTGVTVPGSVTSIGPLAFGGASLASITIVAANPAYSSLNGVLFNKTQTTLIQYPIGRLDSSYTIPGNVTTIGSYAFFSCTSLTGVTIPGSVTTIGFYAFHGCTSLTSVTIPGSVTSIEYSAFRSCPSLTGVFFQGKQPSTLGANIFMESWPIVYYRYAYRGAWGAPFAERPTALWPEMGPIGVETTGMGFVVYASQGRMIVIEACADLCENDWTEIAREEVTGGDGLFNFVDADWKTYPKRFYRVALP